MRALVLTLLLMPGCITLTSASEGCRTGDGEYFVRAIFNQDYYGEPDSLEKQRVDAILHSGQFFTYWGKKMPGSGQVLGPGSAFSNLTRAEVEWHLSQLGYWSPLHDFEVVSASMQNVPDAAFEHLCMVVHENWVIPDDASENRVGCFDGGTVSFQWSTERGRLARDGGCLPDQSLIAADMQGRIDAAYHETVAQATT